MSAPWRSGVEAQLWLWLIAMVRPGAALFAAPVFGPRAVPVQLRLVLSLALGMAALNNLSITMPPGGIATFAGLLRVAGEELARLAIGFAMQIRYSAALVAGVVISTSTDLDIGRGSVRKRGCPVVE